MRKKIAAHVRHCLICASTKRGGALQTPAPQRPRPPVRPWQVISLDVMGPYKRSRSGSRFILVAMDLCTKWVEAKAVRFTRSKQVLNFITEVCQRWGFPQRTITDNGSVFRGASWRDFHQHHHIESYFSPVYHQRANPVERRNQELKKLLRFHNHNKPETHWDEELGQILFTLRNRTNAATGMPPSTALLGAPLVQPGEWDHPEIQQGVDNREHDREDRLRQIRRRQLAFNRNVYPQPREAPRLYEIGEQILVRNFAGNTRARFEPTWIGPFPVLAIHGEGVYEVNRNGAQFRVHVDDIRPAPRPNPDDPEPQPRPPGEPPEPPHEPLPGPFTAHQQVDEEEEYEALPESEAVQQTF